MSRVGKKLAKARLSTALTSIYAPATGKKAQITGIYMNNQDLKASRYGKVTAHGITLDDVLFPNELIPAGECNILTGLDIMLAAGEPIGIAVDAVNAGTAQAGTTATITLASTASAVDDYYNGMPIFITNDTPTGIAGVMRTITDYVGSTKVATVDTAFPVNPTTDPKEELPPLPGAVVLCPGVPPAPTTTEISVPGVTG